MGAALAAPVAQTRALFTGFGISLLRTNVLMCTFFVAVDHMERHHAALLAQPLLGPFMKGAVCATLAWAVAWPWETAKNRIQAGAAAMGGGSGGAAPSVSP